MEITYQKKNYFENVIYDFRIKGEIESGLMKEIKNHITSEGVAQSFMPKYTFLKQLIVKCDHNNEFNPSRTEVAGNIEVVELLKSSGAVEMPS